MDQCAWALKCGYIDVYMNYEVGGWLGRLEESGEGTSGGNEAERGNVGSGARRGRGSGSLGRSRSAGARGGSARRAGLVGGRGRGAGSSAARRGTTRGGGARGGLGTTRRGLGTASGGGGSTTGGTAGRAATLVGGAGAASVGNGDLRGVLDLTSGVLDLDGDLLAGRDLGDLPGDGLLAGLGEVLVVLAAGVAALDGRNVEGGLAAGPREEGRLAL